jgi:hypothetical protein
MSIELLENSELSSLATSRVGSKGFVDDYFNASGKKKAVLQGLNLSNKNYPEQLDNLFSAIKGDKSAVNTSKKYLKQNPELLRDLIKRYGTPKNPEGLRFTNTAFTIFSKFPIPENLDCASAEGLMAQINNEIESESKQLGAGAKSRVISRTLRILEDLKKDVKNIVSKLKCEETQEKLEKERLESETLNAVKTLASEDDKKSNVVKYAIFGVGGLILLIAGIILFKPSKPKV